MPLFAFVVIVFVSSSFVFFVIFCNFFCLCFGLLLFKPTPFRELLVHFASPASSHRTGRSTKCALQFITHSRLAAPAHLYGTCHKRGPHAHNGPAVSTATHLRRFWWLFGWLLLAFSLCHTISAYLSGMYRNVVASQVYIAIWAVINVRSQVPLLSYPHFSSNVFSICYSFFVVVVVVVVVLVAFDFLLSFTLKYGITP